MELIKLYNEIKVNQPGKTFMFTDKAKNELKDIEELRRLIRKFADGRILDIMHDYDIYVNLLNLEIFRDEKVIDIEGNNNIYQLLQGLIKIGWYESEEDKEDVKNLLKDWLKNGWITKINI
jgi:hypothetical protein